MTVVCAIFLLNAFKDWDVSLSSLQGLLQSTREQQQRASSVDGTMPDLTTALLDSPPASSSQRSGALVSSGYQRISSRDDPPLTVTAIH
ncbi:hypothetical protein HPB48_000352 [Haemaphysalis longicornis]|uniref:Uncharacterized protein n=1 Tax=Haemaphysalis longicornis TaxID=44386 RepID=A0A9J6H337_HAELO|nr:hypothetical protein HPB48_000352 [Haemaphysalis longicornis]